MAVQFNNRLRGRTVMVLPASCPHSVLVTGDVQSRNQSHGNSPGWVGGQWSQMTFA